MAEIRRMPPNKWNHALIVERLAHQLRSQLDTDAIFVVTTIFGLVIRRSPVTTRVPDLAVFVKAEIVEQDGYIHSAPLLVVEVVSPGNTRAERTQKLKTTNPSASPRFRSYHRKLKLWKYSSSATQLDHHLAAEGRLHRAASLPRGNGRHRRHLARRQIEKAPDALGIRRLNYLQPLISGSRSASGLRPAVPWHRERRAAGHALRNQPDLDAPVLGFVRIHLSSAAFFRRGGGNSAGGRHRFALLRGAHP